MSNKQDTKELERQADAILAAAKAEEKNDTSTPEAEAPRIMTD